MMDTARLRRTSNRVAPGSERLWEHAALEEEIAQHDSPLPEEQAEQEPGDRTRHGEN